MRQIAFLRLAAGVGAVGTILSWGCTQEPKPVGSPVESAWESPSRPPSAPAAGPAESTSSADVRATNTTSAPAARAADSSKPGTALVAASTRPSGGSIAAAPDPVVATVNGEPISRSQLVEVLLDSHGVGILEQMVLLTAARQKAAALSITLTPEDVKAAEEDALRRVAAPMGTTETQPLDRTTTERLLADFLRIKGLSKAEWMCRMEQRAYMTRIAQVEVAKEEITQEMLRSEYDLAYGERVQIRHVQTTGQDAISRASEMLKHKSFEEVAREASENPVTREQGGLMPPFAAQDAAVPPAIRKLAFQMKVGETSEPLREGVFYHIIRIERRFPASGVGFENVDQDSLRKRRIDRLVRQRTDALDSELFQKAKIEIRDRALDRRFREKHPRR